MRTLGITRAGLLGTLAVLLAAAVCIRLGFWQLDRRTERLERNAVIAERLAEQATALRAPPTDTAGLVYRRAAAAGRFDNRRALVLAGRSHAGAPGVHLLTPLRFGDGAILVDRGWMPAPDAATIDPDAVALEGPLRVEGVLLPFPEAEAGPSDAAFRRTWFRFDGDAMRAQYPYPVAPVYLLATSRPAPEEADTARILPVILEPPTLDPGPHLSYAIQWFSFATIFVVGWAVMVARRDGDENGDAAVDRSR